MTPPVRPPISPASFTPFVAWARAASPLALYSLAALLPAPIARAQNQQNQQAQNPAPAPARTPMADAENPNLPGLSRDERKRRQEILIRKMLQERQTHPAGAPTPVPQPGQQNAANPAAPNAGGKGLPPGAARPGQVNLLKEGQGGVNFKATQVSSVFEESDGYRKVSLYLDPATVVTEVGKTFLTEAKLLTQDKSSIDRVEIHIKYPLGYVEPVSLHQDPVKSHLAGEPKWSVDKEAGTLDYSARFSPPLQGLDAVALGVIWRAVKAGDRLDISMIDGERVSAAYLGGRRVTEAAHGRAGQIVGAALKIYEPEGVIPKHARDVERPGRDFAPALAAMGTLESDDPPRLSLDYRRLQSYEPGDWVVVEVRLDNPAAAALDEVRVALRYDPARLVVVDADDRNLISSGVNILDGPFREAWHWDRAIVNRVDPVAGVIDYRVGTQRPARPASGAFARVFARVKAPCAEPLFEWIWKPGDEDRAATSGVYLLGESLLAPDPTGLDASNPARRRGRLALPAEKADPDLYKE